MSPARPALVVGIDPGTAVTGYGVVSCAGRAPALVECGVVRTPADAPLAERLAAIHEGIVGVLARHRPDTVAVEGAFYAKNVRTAIVLGHARGVILLAAQQAGAALRECAPADVKKAVTGSGAATKAQVQFMVARLLRLAHPPEPADAADGVAIALCAALAPPLPTLPSPRRIPR
ncbi:MAG: crossover junction endodeoxyribonuclease RuvC [Gemmatimonadetes bacterium]|nr:crossover junction endodeoxyribonuclease RuvC [Gemmatimonadota bacterium]